MITVTRKDNEVEFINSRLIEEGKAYVDISTNNVFVGCRPNVLTEHDEQIVAFSVCGNYYISEDDTDNGVAGHFKEIDIEVIVK